MKKKPVKKSKQNNKLMGSPKKTTRSPKRSVKRSTPVKRAKLKKPAASIRGKINRRTSILKGKIRKAQSPELASSTIDQLDHSDIPPIRSEDIPDEPVSSSLPLTAEPVEERPVEVPHTREQPSGILFIGEAALIREYASSCCQKGFDVYIVGSGDEYPGFGIDHPSIHFVDHIPERMILAFELTNLDHNAKKQNLRKLDLSLDPSATILSSSVTVTVTEQSSWVMYKHRLIGIGALPTLSSRPAIEVAPTVFNPDEVIEIVRKIFHHLEKEIFLIQDRTGMVFPRMLCQVINEAAHAIQEGVADPKELDLALKEACQFPFGPLEWADRIGLDQVVAVLTSLQSDQGSGRVRISPLLQQLAHSGKWWNRISE